ncbi:unnamed protein product [Rotaria magnacalcarata]|uniref:F-box domain-containing protein n=2 Tax=Rotaria magnacalcarata TaxID=392030 RepID=A0A815BA73_9BILA|nr:unnamed protein product [Rotaria magnacalcarata]CAF1348502.1 unnamed protein product [Rotaria magnacalcarata]CAF4602606.1 unnamed protein product [Rotaria magnacalcarata]
MSLESLANELFVNIFEYLNTAHLLQTFHGLNSRFDHLLNIFFRANRNLDFRSISKSKFDIVCQHIVPTIIDRIISIRLSDDNQTPQQIDLFLSQFSLSRQCIELRSLSLYQIHSKQTTKRILSDISCLQNLNYLTIDTMYIEEENIFSQMLDVIWGLPALTHCCIINMKWKPPANFNYGTVISSTLEHVSLTGEYISLHQLTCLFQNTPFLRTLAVGINKDYERGDVLATIPSMITLTIHWAVNSTIVLTNFLKKMPNLRRLKIKLELTQLSLNGNQWKEFILDYLPKLKDFHFNMKIFIPSERSPIEKIIDNLLNSFRTFFWLHERQWFVRCDWSLENRHSFASFYTVPYAFDTFSYYNKTISKSTYDDIDTLVYTNVCSLSYNSSFSKSTSFPSVRFCNVQHLKLNCTGTDQPLSVIPKLDRLTSLDLSLCKDWSLCQLETLLDSAPNLYSVIFNEFACLQIQSINVRSKSIRRLVLKGYFENIRCKAFVRSQLGGLCEVLVINLTDRTTILELINTMANLRSLNCKCADDKRKQTNQYSNPTNDEHITWLQQNLPSKHSITRDWRTGHIRIWIHR